MEKFIQLVKECGWKIARLARESKVSRQCIYDIKENRHLPKLQTIEQVCEALGVNYKDYLPSKFKIEE